LASCEAITGKLARPGLEFNPGDYPL